MARSDPSALRWLIGNELRQFRQESGKKAADAAKAINSNYSKIAHIESARMMPHPDEIAGLMRFYGADQYEIDRLTTLAGQEHNSIWWAPWKHVLPDWFRTFVGLEGLAESEFAFDPIAVSGLLQTEDYAREITQATALVRPDHSERFVSFRRARAKRLTDPQPLRLHAVISEAALRTYVGSPEIRRAQYEHLVELAELPHVALQVMRPENGPHPANGGPFMILDFAHARSIAYAEVIDGAVYVQDQDDVGSYTLIAENLQRVALEPDESVAFIKTLIDASP